MAGSLPGFDPEAVRAGLRLAMTVGLPPDAEARPTFFFPREPVRGVADDESFVPFDPNERKVLTPARKVQVPCAVEYFDNSGKIENFGLIVPSKVELTLLDTEYRQVKGFEYVVIGGSRFFYQRTEPPLGLVSVGVFIIHCVAEDQA